MLLASGDTNEAKDKLRTTTIHELLERPGYTSVMVTSLFAGCVRRLLYIHDVLSSCLIVCLLSASPTVFVKFLAKNKLFTFSGLTGFVALFAGVLGCLLCSSPWVFITASCLFCSEFYGVQDGEDGELMP